jgi:translation initiation factor IF-2
MASIRLGKAAKDLNVGISTAVSFLAKKGHNVEANPNIKIADEAYALLVKEFSTDKLIKEQSERLTQQYRQKEKSREVSAVEEEKKAPKVEKKPEEKPAPKTETPKIETPKEETPKVEEIKVEVAEDLKPHFKVIDKIDLDAPKKQPEVIKETVELKVEKVEQPKVEEAKQPEAPKAEPKEEVKVQEPKVQEAKVQEIEVPERKAPETKLPEVKQPEEKIPEEKAPEVKAEPVVEKKIEAAAPAVEAKAEPAEKEAVAVAVEAQTAVETPVEKVEKKEELIFSLSKPVVTNGIKVIGNLDLSTINQRTRPDKKSRNEKRKDREDKQKDARKPQEKSTIAKPEPGKTAAAATGDAQKKKRKRIHEGHVDITKPQPGGGGGNRFQKPTDNSAKGKRPQQRQEVSEEDVQRQVKETLARLTEKKGKGKGAKYRKDKRDAGMRMREAEADAEMRENSILKITEFVTANELASMMDVSVMQVITVCMNLGQMVAINQRLDAEIINIIADEFGFQVEYVSAEVSEAIAEEPDAEEDLLPRPPVVAVMGHVDHGKTSLLDYIRQANVIAGEAGGITQHIGAYNVTMKDGRHITFLDTPGHEAFTAMRARGAKVTDIAIIIVAADDNIMPQTKEAISHASAANVPMIFAINKIDKPTANPEKIKEGLAAMNYLVEDWGGKYQSQDIAAKTGLNVEALLEKVLLEAEMLDLKANPNRRASGSILESSLDKGRGYVAKVLVQNGTLKVGDSMLAGTSYGKVKAMFNERNQRITEAGPAEPVLVLGLNGAPQAGDNFNVMPSEQEAREVATKREQLQREQGLRTKKHLTLEELGRRVALGNFQELNIIVKGDVDGSIEALSDSLIKLSTPEIQVNVIHKAVGAISEADVNLAAASNAIIIGFQVRPATAARKLAEKEEVDIRLYSIIYDAIEEIKSAMEGMLAPEIKEEITATLEVQTVFKITKVGTVAGCLVREGKIKRGNRVRLIRDGIVVFTGELGSLKRFKDDVKEVQHGYECGLNITNYNDIREGDMIESFEEVEVSRKLE